MREFLRNFFLVPWDLIGYLGSLTYLRKLSQKYFQNEFWLTLVTPWDTPHHCLTHCSPKNLDTAGRLGHFVLTKPTLVSQCGMSFHPTVSLNMSKLHWKDSASGEMSLFVTVEKWNLCVDGAGHSVRCMHAVIGKFTNLHFGMLKKSEILGLKGLKVCP